jgi:hypothetical protein
VVATVGGLVALAKFGLISAEEARNGIILVALPTGLGVEWLKRRLFGPSPAAPPGSQ